MAPPDRGKENFSSQIGEDVPLAYLQHMSVCHTIEWDLSKSFCCISLGKLGMNEAYPTGHGRDVLGLQPRLVRTEYPMGETPQLADTFIKQFLKARGDFPTHFHLLGSVYSSDKSWWEKWWALYS